MTEIETEVIDPEAPLKYLRVIDGDEEMAMIPWPEAKRIANAVMIEESEKEEPVFDDWYANNPDWFKRQSSGDDE